MYKLVTDRRPIRKTFFRYFENYINNFSNFKTFQNIFSTLVKPFIIIKAVEE